MIFLLSGCQWLKQSSKADANVLISANPLMQYRLESGKTYTFSEDIEFVKATTYDSLARLYAKVKEFTVIHDSTVIVPKDSIVYHTVLVYDSAAIKTMAEFFRLVRDYPVRR